MISLRRTWQAIALALILVFVTVDSALPARAASASNWDPGYIISDEQFYDSNSMTAAQIQAFFEAKVPTCEEFRTAGPHDPIVCLKNYRVTTRTIPADQYCTGNYVGAANELASTIIYKVAQACGINPKVLIVTLQKEQGLVTHTWPSDYRYQKAMGYGCPDTAPCNAEYFGFQNQVWRAARQFQIYKAKPTSYNYRAGMVNNIYFNPDASCGSSPVLIKNVATASLYNYTPYQPNQAALNNLYNMGDSCSSYGNRNFWRYYTDWFGAPRSGVPSGITVSRVGGADRYETAIGISKTYFPSGAPVVYLATGANFPDALGSAPAAAKQGGPLLLVPKDSLPSSVATELARLAPSTIIVSGGPGAVSEHVFKQLEGYAPTVMRMTGADRYEVSRNVTRYAFGESGATVAYVATGANFPDALSASSAAGSLDAPVILVDGTAKGLPQETAQLIRDLGVSEIRIAGGPASVTPTIENALRGIPGVTTVTRLGGLDRYEVSGAINRGVFSTADTVFLASGLTFPDALAGAAVAGGTNSPLYVIPPECMPSRVGDDILTMGAKSVVVLGGPASVTPRAASFGTCP